MANNIIITGATGFVGKNIFLNESIKDDIITTDEHGKPGEGFKDFNLIGTSSRNGNGFLRLDVLDKKSINEALMQTNPAYIIHLAAQSFVPHSFENPKETYDINFYGTFNLLESLKGAGFKGRLLFVSSSDVYGSFKPLDLSLKETTPLSPKSPYAVSKGAAELLCLQYANAFDIDVVIARSFNHIGLYQDDRFVVSNFAKQIALIALGKKEPNIKVGNTQTSRDFLDVRDVITAYYLLLLRGRKKEIYNVCSGIPIKISYILDKLISFSGKKIVIKTDPERLRGYDIQEIYGDNSKLKSHIGFSQTYDIEKTLLELYNYYLKNF